jgi:copper chaperone NosL
MKRLIFSLCVVFWASISWAQNTGPIPNIPKPAAKDLCPVCGMIVSKYPNWVAVVQWKDGHAHFFDGAKDLFKFLQDLPKFAPGHNRADIKGIYVTDFYDLQRIDARKAIFVTGSDVLGPMGHELVPLANQNDAQDFLKEHKGKQAIPFDAVTANIVKSLDF